MGIRHFRIFKTVCEEGSVTRAAQKLYMTQPAVSHAIKELEAQKGFPLFDRLSGRLYLTEPGKVLLQKATSVLELYDEADSFRPDALCDATIRIGSCITMACYWLPQILRRFQAEPAHRHIRIQTQVAAAGSVMQMLKSNQIDIALLEGPYLLERYIVHPVSSYRIIAVCSPRHPFASGCAVKLGALLAEPLLLREQGSAIRDPFDGWLLLHKHTANPVVTSVNSQALIQMAEENVGVAILADKVAEQEIAAGRLRRVHIPELDITNDISIAYHEGKYIPDSLAQLIAFIKSFGNPGDCPP